MKMAVLLARKELSTLFHAPATYVIAVVFLLLTGWLFGGALFLAGTASLDAFASPIPFLFTFLMPALTMRAFSEEYRSGTIEVLATLPIRDYQIVAGKYMAAMGLLTLLLSLTLVYVIILFSVGQPDPGAMVGAYLGILGIGSFDAAVGLWASTLSRNPVVAFIIGFFTCFAFFLVHRLADFFPEALGMFIRAFSVASHFDAMTRGVIDVKDVLYWFSGTLFFLGAALSVVHSRRWK